ncbi:MAG: phospholipid carrier-dependent glycosyltransferase [Bacteroidia bacterium]|nr:phospholipid carrier-dependent glycosyltransferase [Bacteroidia bacterium]
MVKKIGLYGIVLALLLPLLFINIKNSHDWGDDFAQYIHQAQNILIGQSQNNTGYIYNDNYFIGPTAYPTGFPLLLAVFSKFSDDNLMSLNKLISLFWMLGCFVGFLFFRKHFSYLTALITTLIIAYNPMMIQFKTEILSDLPFMFFSLLSLYLIDKEEKLWLAIATGLLIAFTVHIRSIGFILLGVLIVYKLLNTRKTSEANPYKFLIITLTSFLVLYFGLNLAFPCETNYPGLFDTRNFWLNLNKQLSYNFDKLDTFFDSYEIKNYYYIGVIASGALIAFSFIGFIKFLKTDRTSPVVLYMIAYVLVIVSFKYGDTGMRFLFPVLPIIFLFAIEGLRISFNALNISGPKLAVAFGALTLFSYHEQIEKILDETKAIYEGPNKPEAQKMFEYINQNLKPGTIVEFDKPRALALYTTMHSVAINPQQEKFDIRKEVVKFNIEFILTNDNFTDQKIKDFVNSGTSYCFMIYSVNEFKLYKLNP